MPAPMRVVVYRRLMMRIAERIARCVGAQALVTGDVVGQVASQTLENLAVIGSVATLPIFRPLIGMDKDEITAEAQRGSAAIPFRSFRTRTAARCSHRGNPQTRARLAQVESAEAGAADKELVEQAVREAVLEVRSPAPSRTSSSRSVRSRRRPVGIRGCPDLEDPEVCTWL